MTDDNRSDAAVAPRRPRARRVGLLVAALCVALLGPALLIAFGWVDAPRRGGGSPRVVVGALVVYWLLGVMAVVVLASWRRRWRQLLLAGASLALCVVAAEIGMRALAPRVAAMRAGTGQSERFHHIYPADRRMYAGRYDGQHVWVETNEDGLRSRRSRAEFRGFGRRVALLGDSFTFGLGVRQDATWAARLERELRAAAGDDDVAVLNTGVPSYSPFLESLLYDEVVTHYRPQLVLLMLDATDIGDDHRYVGEATTNADGVFFDQRDHKDRPPYGGALFQALGLGEYLPWPLQFARGLRPYHYYRFHVDVGGVREDDRYFIYRHPLSATRGFFDATMAHVERIAAAVERDGGRFALLVSPRYHHWSARECPANWERDYAVDEPFEYEYFRYFEEQRARVDFPVIDLLPAFRATDRFPLVFRTDPHWNEAGHAFVAETVRAELVRRGLWP